MYFFQTFLLAPIVLAASIITRHHSRDAAAYFLDNNPNGSTIVAMSISREDGTLSLPTRTSTGGKGMLGLDAPAANSTAAPAPGDRDTLFSQNSIIVSGDKLFTVNTGSKTLAMFSIDSNDHLHPRMVGRPVDTMGEFPVAVAYSPKLKTACVLNGGAISGISCFLAHYSKGLSAIGSFRPITLNQTTPPVGPAGTVSDLLFNPSQTTLLASVKGNGLAPGSFIAYPVSQTDNSISSIPIISEPPQVRLNFGISFLGSDHRLAVSDPAIGALLVSISSSSIVTADVPIAVAGESAVCWTEYNRKREELYLMDVAVSNITVVDAKTGAIKKGIQQDDAGLGSLDARLGGDFLYVLKSASEIAVIKTSGGRTVQRFNLTNLGSRQGFVGLATWGFGQN
ncbi:putative 3-carboxymuconate cyclase protein [Botrytis fragariae]|uniref:Putative 3-carboxymuconate cyclase protein n=1 Tax=Botrytis fragariae TaxID=1964551 RepID=A0A8H6ANQ3_9HELO|nr:putative 3-carboxymuconate cyclase protein [Botrytis fragariae]KAF5870635.1 putative 3-carboxymuconate cyclase protein [Botrytis fragariae]